jgi:hypothetical protein
VHFSRWGANSAFFAFIACWYNRPRRQATLARLGPDACNWRYTGDIVNQTRLVLSPATPTGTIMKLSPKQRADFLKLLQIRFEKHMNRHHGLAWAAVQTRLEAHPEKLVSLYEMERTGGEPDVVGQDQKTGEYLFYDCSPESPEGRRSLCYDHAALDSRKEAKPADSAMDMAAAMGITLLTEDQYRALQQLGNFDLKTSSWLETPAAVRKLGGAIFGDRRYDRVFTYHNGAQSYYAARGFRGCLRV